MSQDEPKLERYLRQGSEWRFSETTGLEDAMQLETIGLTLSLARVYKKLSLSADSAKDA